MTHNPPVYPPPEQWPLLDGPDCPACDGESTSDVTWTGTATSLDTGGPVILWECDACCAAWAIPAHHWPVLDGADCPTCLTTVTCWAAIEPDHHGDLWTCEHGHEFVLTPEGVVITPGNEDLSDWAPVWPTSKRDPQDGDAA